MRNDLSGHVISDGRGQSETTPVFDDSGFQSRAHVVAFKDRSLASHLAYSL